MIWRCDHGCPAHLDAIKECAQCREDIKHIACPICKQGGQTMSIDELEKECNINEYGDIDENGHYIFKRFREILAQETTKAINDYQTNDEQRHIASAVRLAKIDELKHIDSRETWTDYAGIKYIGERRAELQKELDNDK